MYEMALRISGVPLRELRDISDKAELWPKNGFEFSLCRVTFGSSGEKVCVFVDYCGLTFTSRGLKFRMGVWWDRIRTGFAYSSRRN